MPLIAESIASPRRTPPTKAGRPIESRSGSNPTKAAVEAAAIQKSTAGLSAIWLNTLGRMSNHRPVQMAPLTVSQRDSTGSTRPNTKGANPIGMRSVTPMPTVSRRYHAIEPKRKRIDWAPSTTTRAPKRVFRMRSDCGVSSTLRT